MLNSVPQSSIMDRETIERRNDMPHIQVMLWPGRDEETKKKFGEKIVEDAMDILGVQREHLSVGFTEIPSDKWNEITEEAVDKDSVLVGELYHHDK